MLLGRNSTRPYSAKCTKHVRFGADRASMSGERRREHTQVRDTNQRDVIHLCNASRKAQYQMKRRVRSPIQVTHHKRACCIFGGIIFCSLDDALNVSLLQASAFLQRLIKLSGSLAVLARTDVHIDGDRQRIWRNSSIEHCAQLQPVAGCCEHAKAFFDMSRRL